MRHIRYVLSLDDTHGIAAWLNIQIHIYIYKLCRHCIASYVCNSDSALWLWLACGCFAAWLLCCDIRPSGLTSATSSSSECRSCRSFLNLISLLSKKKDWLLVHLCPFLSYGPLSGMWLIAQQTTRCLGEDQFGAVLMSWVMGFKEVMELRCSAASSMVVSSSKVCKGVDNPHAWII